jgi:CubicO group peptidase (beta-lactamase class C family)
VLADVTQPTKLFSGGGGLVSTAADYLRFGQMLLNRGELDGVRILSPATVKQMTTNALPSDIRFAGYVGGPRRTPGWLDLGTWLCGPQRCAWSLVPGSVGSFNWMGTSGNLFLGRPGRAVGCRANDRRCARHRRSSLTPFRNLTMARSAFPTRA